MAKKTADMVVKGSNKFAVGLERGSLKLEILKDRSQARARFQFSMIDYSLPPDDKNRSIVDTVVFDVISVWLQPRTNEPIKMHLAPPRHNRIWNAVKLVNGTSGEVPYGTNHSLRLDKTNTAVRYNWKQENKMYLQEEGVYVFFYENKATTIRTLLEYTKEHHPVGGVELVNLNRVPDAMLADIGFVAVPDVLGRGLSMWYGNPDSIGGRGSLGSVEKSKNVASFLNLLQKEVSV